MLNSPAQPAKPGDWVIVYITGLGAVNGAVRTGQAVPVDAPAAALSPDFAGLAQVALEIPDVAPGEQTLELTIGRVTANATVIAVGGK